MVGMYFSEAENFMRSKKTSWERSRNLDLPRYQKLHLPRVQRVDFRRVQKLDLPDPVNQNLPIGRLQTSARAVGLVAEESRPDTFFANRLDEAIN